MSVVLYGHKTPEMPVGILACMRSDHPCVPLDNTYPDERIGDIVEQLDDPCVVSTEEAWSCSHGVRLSFDEVKTIIFGEDDGVPLPSDCSVQEDDPIYILFASGSAGKPKGVVMRASAIDAFADYYSKFMPESVDAVTFNRAPFTFDVSVFAMVIALARGLRMFALE